MQRGTVSRKVRLGGLVAVPVTAAMLAFAAVAFACTPQATIKLAPPSGPVGTNVTVTGTSLTPGTTVKVFWGGITTGRLVGTTTAKSDNTMSLTFQVPADAPNGQTIVAVNQTRDGVALGSPANALFNVNTPGGATLATPAVAQNDPPAATDGAAALAPITDTAPAATPAPVTATRTRPAPTQTAAATRTPAKQTAVAPAVTPAPPAADSTPAVQPAAPTPAPAVTPAAPAAPEATPAAPARRSVMVSMAGDGSNGSPVLAIALVGIGLVLALGASAVVLAGRRDRKAPAKAQR